MSLLSLFAPTAGEVRLRIAPHTTAGVTLRIHDPEPSVSPTDAEPRVLPISRPHFLRRPPRAETPLDRSRRIHHNRVCPACGSARVSLRLEEGRGTATIMPTPGLGKLLGFQCERCAEVWDGLDD